jgi:hypothetical protein
MYGSYDIFMAVTGSDLGRLLGRLHQLGLVKCSRITDLDI